MIHIAFCDDNKTIISDLEKYISEIQLPNIDYDFFYSGSELLNYIEKTKEQYQVYFLDIAMPNINGINTAEIIRKQDQNCIIIFLTDYKEFVYQVFEVLPFRFLSKPLGKSTFNEILVQALEHLRTMNNFFFFKIERENYQIPYSDIMYFESQGRKILLKTNIRDYIFYGKIREIMKDVDGTLFVQCHVSYLVNMEHILSINEKFLVLKNGEQISISKKYRTDVKIKHLEFIKWRCGNDNHSS